MGGGKSEMLVALHQLMAAQRQHASLSQQVRATVAAGAISGTLSATTEADTVLPCVVSFYLTSLLDMDVLPYYQPLPNLLGPVRPMTAA
ncbi:hypothetical protein OG936_35110 [Streptomyces sp. NBC_00846]|uniref:hypothetical protein n=1 Tax=Streptomyces sp. NBC_00846 TaxID=2975849 RepID=UPI00386A568E|nr:hypothetical protein OG936_35110 [Streptomyces sp. NBC_00846]